ncbi:hypothetical protein GCAAIG_10190 [Candidatus Electronema halotolerans]
MNIHDRSVKNYHGSMNNVSTGDYHGNQENSMDNSCYPETPCHEKEDLNEDKNNKVFSSFILPAIIIAFGTIAAAFLTLLWNK